MKYLMLIGPPPHEQAIMKDEITRDEDMAYIALNKRLPALHTICFYYHDGYDKPLNVNITYSNFRLSLLAKWEGQ